jgi:hypothetical protein
VDEGGGVTIVETTGFEIKPLTADEARDLTNKIRQNVALTWVCVEKAYRGQAWTALGYESWDDYCDAEFDGARLRLPREDRREVISSLRDAGLSIRAIAATGIASKQTVERDLAGVMNHDTSDRGAGVSAPAVVPTTPETPAPEPAPVAPTITGIDGKRYPTPRPRPKPSDEERAEEERRDAISRFAKGVERVHSNWPYITGVRDHPWREEILAALWEGDREFLLNFERNSTWKT